MPSITIYFYTGDFPLAYDNHRGGLPQSYATHDELMTTTDRLLELGFRVRLVSFLTEQARRVQRDDLEFVELGARAYDERGLLRADVATHPTDLVVAHFPNPELIRAAIASPSRTMAILANSYGTSVRERLRARRIVRLLNAPKVEWVSNHCLPATMHLADLGVDRAKLVPWDVEHRPSPAERPAKAAPRGADQRAFYAGSVWAAKGVSDLIDALGRLRRAGRDVALDVAGSGELAAMGSLATTHGVEDLVTFLGPVDNQEVARRMADADLVVVPSRHDYPEGLPLTLFEAVASRTPIVCSDHPMFRLHFRDDESAVTFAGGDPDALASAIERALTDVALYARLSHASTDTWAAMTLTARFEEMITEWATSDHPSSWVAAHTLDRMLDRVS